MLRYMGKANFPVKDMPEMGKYNEGKKEERKGEKKAGKERRREGGREGGREEGGKDRQLP